MHHRLHVVAALLLASTSTWARPDVPGSDLFTFDVGDVVASHDSPHFRVHYTLTGNHAVPFKDVDENGVPDHVEGLIALYEDALAAYAMMGFRDPVSDDGLPENGGDGRFDVYLVDFARSADGAYRSERCEGSICSGYMVQENDFVGYSYPSVAVANVTVASHELFHAVQAAYDADQGAVVAEGTAVWASERFDASLRDLEGFAYGYLDNAATPLDAGRGGPVDSFSYGAGIFFEYLSEAFDDDIILDLWQGVADDVTEDADWFAVIDALLIDRRSSFSEAFTEFSTWTLLTGDRADTARSFETGAQMSEREGSVKTLPIDEASFAVFTASSRLLVAAVDDRDELFISLDGNAAVLDGVRVFALPLLADGSVSDLLEVNNADDAVDVGAASDVFVLVVNNRQDGASSRPALCVGDRAEVDACRAEDGGEGEGEDITLGGGGCAASTTSSTTWLPLAVLLMLRRRRLALMQVCCVTAVACAQVSTSPTLST